MRRFAIEETAPKNKCCGWKTKCCLCCFCVLPMLLLTCLLLGLIINAYVASDPFEKKVLDENPTFMNDTEEDIEARALRFAGGIAIPTVSYSPGNQNREALADINDYIKETYPAIHNSDFISFKQINNYSRVYSVKGLDNGEEPPYLLMGHLDVVSPGNLNAWEHDPFNASIQDGFIYGRGGLDNKNTVFGILEALEYITASGDRPGRSFYVAFGHDEEVLGREGAVEIAKFLANELEENKRKLDFLLDEGMMVHVDTFPGVEVPVAVVGVSEKGYLTVNISTNGTQRHSSTPPRESAVGILANAIANLEANPQPVNFDEAATTLKHLASKSNFLHRVMFGNLWLTAPLVSHVFAAKPHSDALQRTTTAVTVLDAGVKENVVPGRASALVNLRVHPADNMDTALAHIEEAIGDDRVAVEVVSYEPPSKASPHSSDSEPFQILANAIQDVYPEAVVVPGLVVGMTDSRHYADLTENIYRFSPTLIDPELLKGFHGIDERMAVDNFDKTVQFYYRLMITADYKFAGVTPAANSTEV